MRKFTFLLSFLFVALGISAQTPNLVQNPSFEEGYKVWTKGPTSSYTDPALVTSGAQDGTNFVQYSSATATTGFYQEIGVTAGKTYKLTFWYKASGDDSDARIWSVFKDAAGTVINLASNAVDDPLRTNNGYLPTSTVWKTHEVVFTVPANAVLFQLALRAYTGGTAAFDNFSLVDTSVGNVSIAPTITPGTRDIYGPTNITITAKNDGVIYYSLDGSTPSNASTQYSGPFTVTGNTTVKAISYETGKDPSSVTTATYTLKTATEISNIAGLRAVTLPSTEVYKLMGEAVLTLKSSSRNAKYIQDATGAILIDDQYGEIKTNYNLGDGITGIIGTLATYAGMLQFSPVANPPAATSTGNTVTPKVITLAEMVNHQAELVTINNITLSDIAGGTGVFQASKNYPIVGTSSEVLRTAYGDLDYIGQTIPTTPENITGVVLTYTSSTGTPPVTTTTQQIVPRSLADMVATGLSGVKLQELTVWTAGGKVNFNAVAGEKVEIYNALGQRLYNALASDGQNTVSLSLKGVAIVKVGNRVGKVIL